MDERGTNLYVGRLAPAPTGALHLGNARTFAIAWIRARQAGGRLLFRLEDLDHPKVKPAAAEQAYRDLAWLGLDWDNDPVVQSERLGLYRDMLSRLRNAGKIYPCICTRKELDSLQSAPNAGEDMVERRYPGTCRGRFANADEAMAASGKEAAWRFLVDEGAVTTFVDGVHGAQSSVLSEWSGDFPVARGDRAGYQLAVVVDDHAQCVTEIVRGDDLLPSTHRQLALYNAFGWRPPAFYHVPLVVGPDGRRLAKRHGDTRLSVLRERGVGPEKALGWIAASCGWVSGRCAMTMDEVLACADCSRMPSERVVVQPDDLAWMGF